MRVDCAGKVAVITGASQGLGAALAEDYARRGLRLGLCSRSAPALASGDDVVAEQVDVTDEKGVEEFTRAVEDRFGAIDLWINNAGVLGPLKPIRDIALEDFREHIDINLIGQFLCTRSYVQHLRRQREGGTQAEGVLINISSGAARNGYAGMSPYCTGKAGLDRLAECVQLEEEETGLRAYAVAPGVIDTEMQTVIRATPADDFPAVDRFLEMKRDDTFNTPGFVAEHLLAIAFDPESRPEEVCVWLPDEVPH